MGLETHFWLSIGLILSSWISARGDEISTAPIFEEHILPILKAHCFDCHGGRKNKHGLDARQRRLLLRGGDTGPAIAPGKAEASLLFRKISAREMPPGSRAKLSAEEIETVRRWIDGGAPTAQEEKPLAGSQGFVTEEDRRFWAFQTVRRPQVPALSAGGCARTPIDAFLLEKLQAQGLNFSPEAERPSLIRRAALDLTGLPPEPEEVEAFIQDLAPGAWERLLDRLLASPHYGERWGRHWLDAAGYADSEGYTDSDMERPHAWKYRDYVIRAFNEDKPYDQFLLEQLAGDELAGYPGCGLNPRNLELLTATGYLRMAADGSTDASQQLLARNQVIADTVKIFTSGVLGLTIGCAQCHDHRYDPISQIDYHRLRAAFEPAYDLASWKPPAARRISLYTEADRKKVAEVNAAVEERQARRQAMEREFIAKVAEGLIQKEVPEAERDAVRAAYQKPADRRAEDEKKLLARYPQLQVSGGTLYQYDPAAVEKLKAADQEIARIAAPKPPEDFIRALTEEPGRTAAPCRLLVRGNPEMPAEEVEPGVPEVLVSAGEPCVFVPENEGRKTSGRRLALARWLARPENPLTARVLVNRVWWHHFGRGLVGTLGDFGTQGEKPAHPELLDWLADEFMKGGWRLKRLHKLIMTSMVYCQASSQRTEAMERDPDNQFYWRKPLVRLEGEAIRDGILAASGRLNRKAGGPPVPVREDAEGRIDVGLDQKAASNLPGAEAPIGAETWRRTIYVQVRRSRPLSFTKTFDVPDVETNCTARQVSIVAPQALTLLNGGFARAQAEFFARRVEKDAAAGGARVDRAFQIALGRLPAPAEREQALAFLRGQAEFLSKAKPPENGKEGAAAEEAAHIALKNFCQALFNTSEFITVD